MRDRGAEVTRFCVLTTQRSGSTWLMDLLGSHPRIQAYNEVFVERQWHILQARPELGSIYASIQPDIYFYDFQEQAGSRRPWVTFAYLDHLCAPSPDYDAVGYKLMYNQLKRLLELTWKMKVDRYRIVHLVRSNYLDIIISRQLRYKRNVMHAVKELPPDQVLLDTKHLLENLQRADRRRRRGDALLRATGMPTLRLTYESLCEDPAGRLAEVCDFCGVGRVALRSDYKKLNRSPHWESVANYEEVRHLLQGTRFESLLAVRP